MVAQVLPWHSGRHSDRSMDSIGRPKEAQWWYKEGRRVAQIDTQCSHFLLGDQWPTTVHPFCDHNDVCAFILPPLSDLWASDRPPWRPLCDCFEHAQNFTATMAMSERPMCHPWTTKATVRPPFCHQRRPGQFCSRTREAQRSQPLCKLGIIHAGLLTFEISLGAGFPGIKAVVMMMSTSLACLANSAISASMNSLDITLA